MGLNTYPSNPWPMSTDQKGSGDIYELPVASADTLGGVKVGSNLVITEEGVLSAPAPYVLPTAGAETLGGVKVGEGLSINTETGVLSVSGGSVTGNDYSTTEQKVGTWIDGKDLYQKTYILREDGVDKYTYTSTAYDLGETFDFVFMKNCAGIRTTGNYIDVMSWNGEFLLVPATDGKIASQFSSRYKTIYITLLYTKPTV